LGVLVGDKGDEFGKFNFAKGTQAAYLRYCLQYFDLNGKSLIFINA
jgi:hypothetical protein